MDNPVDSQSNISRRTQDPGVSTSVPGQPATPRMLRSVAGSLRNSKTDVDQATSPTPDPPSANHRAHSRNASSALDPHTPSHRRNVSFQATPGRGAAAAPSTTPSVAPSNIPPPAPTTLNPKIISQYHQQQMDELLPAAAIESAAQSPGRAGHPAPARTPNASTGPNKPSPQQQQQQPQTHQHNQAPQNQQQQPFHRKSIGDWDFVKTIGAGSMGKVKLAQHHTTGEICAVKIVPRAAKLYQRAHANDGPPLTAQEAAQRQKDFDKEIARDKRTTREGALGRLLFHPFICRLYEIVPMTNHYYMLFEYVEGGQMLDYIVAHGSLKEKHARKFARGIASALDYCHRNNVVHRDLKIENIMINQKGDIKIIDFGLSNLYSPKSLLKTYCGSLYFAAPELLCAKPYMGPEVDVWSFGVVLYVLVCGKVPFDDQSVSVLHEKIKRANVEYPAFLSKECVSLLSRMLQVDPLKRAKLYEVMNHPWMNKGYEYGIATHIPKRIPLTLPLDAEVIKAISAYDLGSAQSIADELTTIVGSIEYQVSSENWYKIMEQGREYGSASNAHLLPDPTGGFHPLISIYYLVQEMRRRKKAKEEVVKAQLEQMEQQKNDDTSRVLVAETIPMQQAQLAPPKPQPQLVSKSPAQASHEMQASPPSQAATPKLEDQQTKPSLAFPEQAHTSTSSPHHRTAATGMEPPIIGSPIPNQQPQSPRSSLHDGATGESTKSGINSIFRRLSSKKSRNGAKLSPTRTSSPPGDTFSNKTGSDAESTASPSKLDPMVRRGVSMKVTAKERLDSTDSRTLVAEQKPAPKPPKDTRKGHGRSSSINAGSAATNNKFHGFVPVEYLPPLPHIDTETNQILPSKEASEVSSVSGRKLHPTARSKSVGHSRKDSANYRPKGYTGRPPLPNAMGTQNSDEMVGRKDDVGAYNGFFDDIELDDVDYHDIPQLTEGQIVEQFNNAQPNTMLSIEYPKTLFLKGFFSVQTTSTKPLPVIRYNIINVLSKLGVKFQEVKGGFVCAHVPSLQTRSADSTDNNTMVDSKQTDKEEDELYGDAFTTTSIEQHSRTPESEEARSRGPSRQPSLHLNTQNLSTPKSHHRQSSSISSVGSGSGHRRKFSIGNSLLNYRKKNGSQTNVAMPPNTPAAARINKALYGEDFDDDYDAELRDFTEDDSVDSVGNIMIGGGSDMLSSRIEQKSKHHSVKQSPLKFEIHVVKFPLVGLYGVQFKKLLGNTWNYKTLATQILSELKL